MALVSLLAVTLQRQAPSGSLRPLYPYKRSDSRNSLKASVFAIALVQRIVNSECIVRLVDAKDGSSEVTRLKQRLAERRCLRHHQKRGRQTRYSFSEMTVQLALYITLSS